MLAILYRRSFDANLTLSDKKYVDIAVVLGLGGTPSREFVTPSMLAYGDESEG